MCWVYPPFYEINRITSCAPQPALEPGDPMVRISFADGRYLLADEATVRSLCRVLAVQTPADLRDIDVEVTTEPLPGYAEVKRDVFVGPLGRSAT